MSVKSKVSLTISLIVLVLLALNVIVNDYATRVNLNERAESDMNRVARQFAGAIGQYHSAVGMYEEMMMNRLKSASLDAAAGADGQYGKLTSSQLSAAAKRYGFMRMSLIAAKDGGLVTMQSTNAGEVGEKVELPVNPLDAASSSVHSGIFELRNSPDGDKKTTEVAAYYVSPGSTFLFIGIPVVDELWTSLRQTSPAAMKEELSRQFPELLELTVFDPAAFREGAELSPPGWDTVQFGSGPIAYGTYAYGTETDTADVAQAALGGVVQRHTDKGGRSLMKNFAPVNGDGRLVVGVVVDDSAIVTALNAQRSVQLAVSGILLLLVVLSSYWLAGYLIRPVKSILLKVNEVAAGQFDKPLEVNSRDEFGELSERINTMSKNLDIYTAKLKIAFEENRSMKEHLESFINHTTDAIHVVDLEGRILQVNRAFEELFGWREEEAVGHRLQLVPEPYEHEEKQALAALTSGKPQSARETTRMTKSGEWISVSVTTSPIRDRNGALRAIASITRDMTSRNKMDELLRQSEKLTTVGQLAAGVAHEIRNPLTTLRGFLQLQQETHKLNPRHTDLMLSELDRINLIVGEFLILAKPQASRYEVKDVRFVLGDVISLLDSQAHLCNIVFDTQFTSENCEVSCEENQLKQVFINVLKNAIEAMPHGGNIHMYVNKTSAAAIAVTIVDEGIGIPEDMIPKLGDPFFTGKETGTGLGIMVSQRIIQSHQGTMEIRSKLDEGTTVIITLPVSSEDGVVRTKPAM